MSVAGTCVWSRKLHGVGSWGHTPGGRRRNGLHKCTERRLRLSSVPRFCSGLSTWVRPASCQPAGLLLQCVVLCVEGAETHGALAMQRRACKLQACVHSLQAQLYRSYPNPNEWEPAPYVPSWCNGTAGFFPGQWLATYLLAACLRPSHQYPFPLLPV